MALNLYLSSLEMPSNNWSRNHYLGWCLTANIRESILGKVLLKASEDASSLWNVWFFALVLYQTLKWTANSMSLRFLIPWRTLQFRLLQSILWAGERWRSARIIIILRWVVLRDRKTYAYHGRVFSFFFLRYRLIHDRLGLMRIVDMIWNLQRACIL